MQYIYGSMYVTSDNSFNKLGQPMELTEPKGTMVYYTRDGVGRITGIQYKLSGQTSNTTLVSNVNYLPFGPVSSITYGTGSSARTLNRNYDQDYVISSVKDSGTGGLDLNYGRDLLGDITQIANTAGTSGNKYLYDGMYRLTNVNDLSNNPVAAYTLDATGNRTSKTIGGSTANYTYSPGTSHWLYHVDGSSGNRSYDADGSTTSNGNGIAFTYTDSERISQVKNASTNAILKSYIYDARGERSRKNLNGDDSQTIKTVFDDSGHILGDFDQSNAIIDETIWMDDLPVGVLNEAADTVDYIEPDHLGTPRAVIDPARNLAVWNWPILNDPFGETAPNQDADGDGTAYTLNLRLPGQEWDSESGLNYNFQRDYDSAVDRYFESDPIGLAGGISTFAYATGNPLAGADPFGLIPVIVERFPNGATYIPMTVVKTDAQASEWGLNVGDSIPIAVPPGVDPMQAVDDWGSGSAANWWFTYGWAYRQGGPKDYKKNVDPIYDQYGNFEFGAAGSAMGYSCKTIHRWADWEKRKKNTPFQNAVNSNAIQAGYDAVNNYSLIGVQDYNPPTGNFHH